MLHLKTAAGERLEIPAGCIIAVMKPCDGVNPSAIIHDIGAGPQVDQLSDQYGFVKKSLNDASGIVNPIEVRVVEQVEGEPKEGRLLFARSRIVARREVLDGGSILFVDLTGKPIAINVADTLDELDGVEPATPAQIVQLKERN